MRTGAIRTRFGWSSAVVGWALLAIPATVLGDLPPVPAGIRIQEDANVLIAKDPKVFDGLRSGWAHDKTHRFTVVQLGDSHVQFGRTTAELRRQLTEARGSAGLGLVFPYSVVKSYSPVGYTSQHTGKWELASTFHIPPKLPLGVLGVTGRTERAGSSFTLTFDRPPAEEWRELRIFCNRSRESFDLDVETANRSTHVKVDEAPAGAAPYVRVKLKAIGPTLTVRAVKRHAGETSFELHGLSLESTRKGGALVHAAGVGGSRYRALLYQERLSTELHALDPDVVVVEWGTNDFLYDDLVKPELEGEIRQGLHRVRAGAPNATIVLVTAQDLYFRGKNILATAAFAELIRRIAVSDGYALWDWYRIAGGGEQLLAWQAAGLARPDLIHLTAAGYRLKGALLARALMGAAGPSGSVP